MAAIKRAWSDTKRSIKRRGLPELSAALLLYVGVLVAAHEFKGVRKDVPSALAALLVTAAIVQVVAAGRVGAVLLKELDDVEIGGHLALHA